MSWCIEMIITNKDMRRNGNSIINNNIYKAAILLLSCHIMFGIVKVIDKRDGAPYSVITGILLILIVISYILFVYWMKESAILLGKNKNLWIVLSVVFHIVALIYIVFVVRYCHQDKYILSDQDKNGNLPVVNLSCQHCGTINALETNICSSCGRPI